MTFLTQAILGTLLCNDVPKDIHPARTCILSLTEPLPEGNWLTFFSENHVIVAGNYPTGTKTLSIGPTDEKVYLLQFYDGQQIKAVWTTESDPEVTIQPVGEPIVLRIIKSPLRLMKKLMKGNDAK